MASAVFSKPIFGNLWWNSISNCPGLFGKTIRLSMISYSDPSTSIFNRSIVLWFSFFIIDASEKHGTSITSAPSDGSRTAVHIVFDLRPFLFTR